jgi:hypothetical protein
MITTTNLHEYLQTPAKTVNDVESRLLPGVVVRKSAAFFEMKRREIFARNNKYRFDKDDEY